MVKTKQKKDSHKEKEGSRNKRNRIVTKRVVPSGRELELRLTKRIVTNTD